MAPLAWLWLRFMAYRIDCNDCYALPSAIRWVDGASKLPKSGALYLEQAEHA
jgi:hypothetical protein